MAEFDVFVVFSSLNKNRTTSTLATNIDR